MNETSYTNWPGVRETSEGRFSYTINVGNRLFIDSAFFDAESAARAMEETKYTLVQSGHLKRCNFWIFPDVVARWQSGEVYNPQPNSDLCKFMAANYPRYAPLAQRQAEEEQEKLAKAKKVFTMPLPSKVKLFAIQQGLDKVFSITPSRLTVEERSAYQIVLESLTKLILLK